VAFYPYFFNHSVGSVQRDQ